MSKILRVGQGDYSIKVPDGNTIQLDTGEDQGVVRITGDLVVLGTSTNIQSTVTTITDNTIILNSGETGNGISLTTAGIKIDRGHAGTILKSAQFLFNESLYHYDTVTSTSKPGTFELITTQNTNQYSASLNVKSIELSAISCAGAPGIVFNLDNTNSKLTIINGTYGSIKYEDRVTADNDIVTVKWVNNYVAASEGTAIVDRIYKVDGTEKSKILATITDLQFSISATPRAVINASGLTVDTVNLFGNVIKNVGSGSPLVNLPLVLQSDANLVEINSVLTLNDLVDGVSNPTTSIANKTKIYSKDTEGPGRTGIYFTNNNTYGANSYNNDELVSRNRAVLLSMLF